MEGDEIRKVKRSGNKSKTTNYGDFVEIKESDYQGRYPKSVLKFKKIKSIFIQRKSPSNY
jgi:hypothetical protein